MRETIYKLAMRARSVASGRSAIRDANGQGSLRTVRLVRLALIPFALPLITIWPTLVLSSDLTDRFYREATKAWSELLERRTIFGQVWVVDEQPSNGDAITDRAVYKAADKHFLIVEQIVTRSKTSETHEGMAWCVNEAYAFEVKRKTAHDPWVLTDLAVFGREGDPSRLLRYRDCLQHLVKYDLLLVAQMPLPDMVQKPYFKVLEARPVNADGNEYVEVAFEYAHPLDEAVPILGNPVMFDQGTVVLDPRRFWIIKSYQCTGKPSKWGGESKVVVHCELGGAAIPVLRRREEQRGQKGTVDGSPRRLANRKEEYQEVELSRTASPEDFTLSAFGLPEPEFVKNQPTPTRWWLWGILAGFGFLVLGAVFDWLRRRTKR
jgi:hypothetical protein